MDLARFDQLQTLVPDSAIGGTGIQDPREEPPILRRRDGLLVPGDALALVLTEAANLVDQHPSFPGIIHGHQHLQEQDAGGRIRAQVPDRDEPGDRVAAQELGVLAHAPEIRGDQDGADQEGDHDGSRAADELVV